MTTILRKLFVATFVVMMSIVGIRCYGSPTIQPHRAVQTPALAMKTVHRGEGLEHPMIRQLMANPDLVVNTHIAGLKTFTGDRNNKAALKKWAGIQADILARNTGFIGPLFNEEIRVKMPETTAVSIEKESDGSLKIVEQSVQEVAITLSFSTEANATVPSNTGPSLTQIASQNVATTSAAAHFIGPQNGTIALRSPYSQFAYMFVPN